MDAPLSGQERPRITRGATCYFIEGCATRLYNKDAPDLGLLVLGLILVAW